MLPAQITDGHPVDVDSNRVAVVRIVVLKDEHGVDDTILAIIASLTTNALEAFLILGLTHYGKGVRSRAWEFGFNRTA